MNHFKQSSLVSKSCGKRLCTPILWTNFEVCSSDELGAQVSHSYTSIDRP